MKKLILILSILAVIASCEDDNSNNNSNNNSKVVIVNDDITVTTTWSGDSIYIIEDYDFWVEATLKIEAGCIIKLGPKGKHINIDETGTVIARGTAEKPIIFTSIKDDIHGGDNNNDGDVTTPKAGDWSAIYVEANSCIFEFCEFYYGGNQSYLSTLEINADYCQVNNCIFAYNKGGKSGDFYYGALDASLAGRNTEIKNNIFYKNEIPLSINCIISLDKTNIFHSPSDITAINTMNGIFITYNDYIDIAVNWSEDEVPFVIDGNIMIRSSGSITIGNDVILKFTAQSGIIINRGGSLNYGSNCWFTSFKDDDLGGDTNGDGNTTTPNNDDWKGIYDDGSSKYLTWSNILYNGQ